MDDDIRNLIEAAAPAPSAPHRDSTWKLVDRSLRVHRNRSGRRGAAMGLAAASVLAIVIGAIAATGPDGRVQTLPASETTVSTFSVPSTAAPFPTMPAATGSIVIDAPGVAGTAWERLVDFGPIAVGDFLNRLAPSPDGILSFLGATGFEPGSSLQLDTFDLSRMTATRYTLPPSFNRLNSNGQALYQNWQLGPDRILYGQTEDGDTSEIVAVSTSTKNVSQIVARRTSPTTKYCELTARGVACRGELVMPWVTVEGTPLSRTFDGSWLSWGQWRFPDNNVGAVVDIQAPETRLTVDVDGRPVIFTNLVQVLGDPTPPLNVTAWTRRTLLGPCAFANIGWEGAGPIFSACFDSSGNYTRRFHPLTGSLPSGNIEYLSDDGYYYTVERNPTGSTLVRIPLFGPAPVGPPGPSPSLPPRPTTTTTVAFIPVPQPPPATHVAVATTTPHTATAPITIGVDNVGSWIWERVLTFGPTFPGESSGIHQSPDGLLGVVTHRFDRGSGQDIVDIDIVDPSTRTASRYTLPPMIDGALGSNLSWMLGPDRVLYGVTRVAFGQDEFFAVPTTGDRAGHIVARQPVADQITLGCSLQRAGADCDGRLVLPWVRPDGSASGRVYDGDWRGDSTRPLGDASPGSQLRCDQADAPQTMTHGGRTVTFTHLLAPPFECSSGEAGVPTGASLSGWTFSRGTCVAARIDLHLETFVTACWDQNGKVTTRRFSPQSGSFGFGAVATFTADGEYFTVEQSTTGSTLLRLSLFD